MQEVVLRWLHDANSKHMWIPQSWEALCSSFVVWVMNAPESLELHSLNKAQHVFTYIYCRGCAHCVLLLITCFHTSFVAWGMNATGSLELHSLSKAQHVFTYIYGRGCALCVLLLIICFHTSSLHLRMRPWFVCCSSSLATLILSQQYAGCLCFE